MVNVADREAILSEMLTLVRPGGTVVLSDIDNVSWLCQPPHPSWDILLNAFHTVFHAGGGDGFIGRRLPIMLRAAGIPNVQIKITVATPGLGYSRPTHILSLIASVCAEAIAKGLLDETPMREPTGALSSQLH